MDAIYQRKQSNLFQNVIDFRTNTFAWSSSPNQFDFIGLSFLVKRQEILSVRTRMKLHDSVPNECPVKNLYA